MNERARTIAAVALPPLLLAGALLVLWEWAAQSGWMAEALNLSDFVVPAPSEIASALWENRSLLLENAWVTLREVLGGFALALFSGVAIAVLQHLSPLARRAIYPFTVASQAVPLVVIAPVLVVWLGFGFAPKVLIIALICFFPICVNTLDGLATADAEQRKLMRSLGAGRLQTLRLLEAPTALPYLLSGAKVAVAVAVIGAVFGEWAGSDAGLGHLIQLDDGQFEVARLFATTLVLGAMAILLFGAVALLERRIAWWGPGGTGAETG